MRMLMQVTMPHEPFNTHVRKGTTGELMKKILDEIKPEAAYFIEWEGHRCAMLIVNVEHSSQIPALAEPWFLNFHGDCRFRICMTAQDLDKAGLPEIGKKWA